MEKNVETLEKELKYIISRNRTQDFLLRLLTYAKKCEPKK